MKHIFILFLISFQVFGTECSKFFLEMAKEFSNYEQLDRKEQLNMEKEHLGLYGRMGKYISFYVDEYGTLPPSGTEYMGLRISLYGFNKAIRKHLSEEVLDLIGSADLSLEEKAARGVNRFYQHSDTLPRKNAKDAKESSLGLYLENVVLLKSMYRYLSDEVKEAIKFDGLTENQKLAVEINDIYTSTGTIPDLNTPLGERVLKVSDDRRFLEQLNEGALNLIVKQTNEITQNLATIINTHVKEYSSFPNLNNKSDDIDYINQYINIFRDRMDLMIKLSERSKYLLKAKFARGKGLVVVRANRFVEKNHRLPKKYGHLIGEKKLFIDLEKVLTSEEITYYGSDMLIHMLANPELGRNFYHAWAINNFVYEHHRLPSSKGNALEKRLYEHLYKNKNHQSGFVNHLATPVISLIINSGDDMLLKRSRYKHYRSNIK